jgi:hypothetical protein
MNEPRDIIAAALATIYGNVFLHAEWDKDAAAVLFALTDAGIVPCRWNRELSGYFANGCWVPVEETP